MKKFLQVLSLAAKLAAAVLAVAVLFVMLRSSVKYKVMSNTEQLKAQLMEERQNRSRELFEGIEVERPWYSLSPADWTFAVTFAGGETVYYQRVNRTFVPIE